ncbi:hypothetical protein [Mesorhizobium sp. KR1-2]|uniref:hypothetical protein n=1 Tax=Mesorhizobium sp. KR1-2 TaxID=3156609 RepID=UPI0032B49577
MNEQMTLRDEQVSAIREAADRLASRISHVFNFDPQKLEDFQSSNRETYTREPQAPAHL